MLSLDSLKASLAVDGYGGFRVDWVDPLGVDDLRVCFSAWGTPPAGGDLPINHPAFASAGWRMEFDLADEDDAAPWKLVSPALPDRALDELGRLCEAAHGLMDAARPKMAA